MFWVAHCGFCEDFYSGYGGLRMFVSFSVGKGLICCWGWIARWVCGGQRRVSWRMGVPVFK